MLQTKPHLFNDSDILKVALLKSTLEDHGARMDQFHRLTVNNEQPSDDNIAKPIKLQRCDSEDDVAAAKVKKITAEKAESAVERDAMTRTTAFGLARTSSDVAAGAPSNILPAGGKPAQPVF